LEEIIFETFIISENNIISVELAKVLGYLLKFGAIQGKHQLGKRQDSNISSIMVYPRSSLCQLHEFNGLCKWQVLFGLMNHVS
jgi:hypothetical protein